jgi:hypothetical protein
MSSFQKPGRDLDWLEIQPGVVPTCQHEVQMLVVIGNPRKTGNSYKRVNRIEERMRMLGNVEFNYLLLRDVNLELSEGVGRIF